MKIEETFEILKNHLKSEIFKNNLFGTNISIRCQALSPEEAIGNPEARDYPIIKGKEVMVEANFLGAKGQAFTGSFENADYKIEELLQLDFSDIKKRTSFIAALNAIYRYLKLTDKTVHCKDEEPKECAENLTSVLPENRKIFLVGFQPRFFEFLAKNRQIRVVDRDEDNIGKTKFGVTIESAERTEEFIEWCDMIFVTGSTVVNGTITKFLNAKKPVIFYGVTISAAAKILHLDSYCFNGH
ncbi:MAG: hypothetical protein DRZ79_06005 [Candidatus Cloacimonadota bacterium]|nr:MAG: hypothetical protein DRZ79_06005 [Candidatus Cloacimonadota bacterium]